ncbi:MAG: hypothetical protein PWP38_2010 [Clostridiales bacterium]|nr:hypothetical protein [Clostridiales bacterium]
MNSQNQFNHRTVFRSKEGQQLIRDYYNQIITPLPFKQHHLATSYGETFVLEAGVPQNPVMILLHGSCSNSAAWLADMPLLVSHYHLYAIDWLGEPGNSEAVRLNFENGEYTQWLNEVLNSLAVTKAIIIGNSMGGWLALHYAAAYPKRTDALILLASSGIVPPDQSFIDRTASLAVDNNAKSPNTEQLVSDSASIIDAVMDTSTLPKEVLEFMTLIMTHFIPMTGELPILPDSQMRNLSMPVLCVMADGDMTLNPEAAANRLKTLVPHATVKSIEGPHTITYAAEYIMPFLNESR